MEPAAYKAIVPDTSPELLSWRATTGADFRDEVWSGVYHVAFDKLPAQTNLEIELESWLLTDWCCKSGGRVFRDTRISPATHWENDFRVPSFALVFDLPPSSYDRNLISSPPDVVIELFGPSLVNQEKIDFYLEFGVREIWMIDFQSGLTEIINRGTNQRNSPVNNLKSPLTSAVTGIKISCKDSQPVIEIPGEGRPRKLSGAGTDVWSRYRRKPK